MRYVRLILAGALLGAGLYFTPFFILRFFFFGILIFAFFRLLAGPRWGWGRHQWAYAGGPFGPGMRGYGPMGFADKVRAMTEEEYKAFQDRFNNAQHHYGCRGGWQGRQDRGAAATPSTEPQNPTQNSTETNA